MANRRNLIGKIAVMMGEEDEVVQSSYTVNLNSNWQNSTINPDSSTYNSYESYSNKGTGNSDATMYIYIRNYSSFKMYIRSYAESNYDYVMVSQLDKTITGTSSYSDTTLVKAHTRGNQQSGSALSNYTLVEFTGITPGEHTITVVYRKDGSVDENDDKGYLLIAKDASNAGSNSGSGDDEGESSANPIDINNYLTIVALEDGLTAKLSVNACEYCVDGTGNWKSLSAGTATESINSGQTLSFRGNNLTASSTNGIGTFTISKSCNLEGNCMSMLFRDNASSNTSLSGKAYAFYELFQDCTTIKSVSNGFLPATTLADYCYGYMFYGCTSLIQAPALPTTTLAKYCYYNMFKGCASLTTAPALPATNLADSNFCYYGMFYNCTSLTQAPELPAMTLGPSCYSYMFNGCASLTTAPILPATTLDIYCYNYMFEGCTKLNYIKAMFISISYASMYIKDWVKGVASTGTFVKNQKAIWNETGSSGIPSGWTVQTV